MVSMLTAGLVALLALALASCASARPYASPVYQGPDAEAIMQVWRIYERGINASDLDLWLSLWDENGIQFPPDEAMHRGKAEIRAANVNVFPILEMRMTISPQEIAVLGDYAYSSGGYVLDFSERGSGEWTQVDGKFLTILRRQADGGWKIWRDCFNYDPPKE
jgi:uncharacterized protein (TIGR02246 family)